MCAVCFTRRSTLLALGAGFAALAVSARSQPSSKESANSAPVLISNVRIFNGSGTPPKSGNVLISDRKIEKVSASSITPPSGAKSIDGGGRVLMPGLTDAHWHMVFAPNTLQDLATADTGLMYANAVAEARRTLMRGFTTVRDTGGPTFGLKEAIDAGDIPGPRVYPSGALISQTGGHGDFGPPYARPVGIGGQPSHYEDIGAFAVANGVPQVLAAVRDQLKKGASQIKLALGGGVISDSDPIDTLQFTPDEIRAAVQATTDWGTYVAVHVYTSVGIQRALNAGIKSIEHGHLADEETIRLIGEKGAWLSTQPFQMGDNPLTPAQLKKAEATATWRTILGWAKQYGVKVAFGTDLLFQPEGTYKENIMLTRFADIYSNLETLKIATSGNCELFALSGERNPYKEAKLGLIEEGAWADMLLVDGDPTRDINVLKDYERNLVMIMKNGTIYKNMLT